MIQGLVQIQIVNYINWELTLKCVESLKKQTYKNYRILIIDNASPNDSFSQLRKYGSDFSLFQTQKNIGYGGAQNIGFFHHNFETEPEYYLTVNNDAILDKNCLFCLVETIRKYQDCAIASPVIYKDKIKNKIDNVGYNLSYKYFIPLDMARLTGDHSKYIRHGERKVTLTDDVVALMRREAIRSVRGYDESYFMYVETTDLTYRLKRKGYCFVVNYNAVAYHGGKGASKGLVNEFSLYYKLRNWIKFQRKHFPIYHMLYTVCWILIMYIYTIAKLLYHRRIYTIVQLNKHIFSSIADLLVRK